MDKEPDSVRQSSSPASPPTQYARGQKHLLHSKIEPPLLINRARLLTVFLVAIMVIALVRAVSPQITESTLALQSSDPERGRIVDRNGFLLATDMFLWEAYAAPPKTTDLAVHVKAVSKVLGISTELVQEKLTGSPSLVVLQTGITREQCATLDYSPELPTWIWCDGLRRRSYPLGSLASHVVGFANYNRVGAYGVEAAYDAWLRSDNTWAPSLGEKAQEMPDAWQLFLPSLSGRDLVMTIDGRVQHRTEAALLETTKNNSVVRGTVIVMDPETGDLLALANYPSFDLNQFTEVETSTWVNPATSQFYEPGTVFSLITVASALDAGTITSETKITSSREITVAGLRVIDSMADADSALTLAQVLAHPHTVAPSNIALQMGAEAFYRYLRQFGFGRLTEVDLSGENQGVVVEPSTSSFWTQFDLAANSFGQGINVTPLQMINAVAAIANNGARLQPKAAAAFVVEGQIYPIASRKLEQSVRPETARQVVQLMVEAAKELPGIDLGDGYQVAGQFGIAEIPTSQGYNSTQRVVSFVGFFPAEDPKLVILVKLDSPRAAKSPELMVTTLFNEVAREAIRILEVQPH